MSAKCILHLSSENSWRGGEQQMAYLIEESRKAGLEVLVAGKRGSAFAVWCKNQKVPFYPMSFKNGLDLSTSIGIKKLVSKQRPDIVHTHSGKSQSLLYWAALLGMKTPVVVHRRVDFPLKSGGLSLKKYTFAGVKAIICVSNTIEKMVKAKVGFEKFVTTVYSGIDFGRFNMNKPTGYLHRELGIPAGTKLVANVSALAPHKDYPTFLRAVKSFSERSEGAHFLIVGGGELEHELKQLSRDMGVENKVTFTGFRKDIPELLREVSIFLITSKTEGLGTTVIDAMHNALPVVATRGGGITELVEDGQTGFLCDVGDHVCLAEKIIDLLSDYFKAKSMGDEGAKRSLQFSKEEMAKKVMEVYDRILD